jgi:hypothetical protein
VIAITTRARIVVETLGPFPLRTPSKNDIKASPGRHAWNRDRAITRGWLAIIRPCHPAKRPYLEVPDLTRRSTVRRVNGRPRMLEVLVTLGKASRRYDILNLYAGLNPVVDVLVARGYLVNDSPVWLTDVRATEVPSAYSADSTLIRLMEYGPA